MDEAEVDTENRILYITPTNLNAVQALETTKSREVLASFSKIVKVPQSRFYTKIDLLDGTITIGGYEKQLTESWLQWSKKRECYPIQNLIF